VAVWSALLALVDLVLPTSCGGCGRAGPLICTECAEVLAEQPTTARPTPAPAGLPPCRTGGPYDGVRRELVLNYKERGRRALAAPLAHCLAEVVASGMPASGAPVVLVPVPATAAAIRARYGDHMLVLAGRCATRLRGIGVAASVATPLWARPRPDSVHLDREQRAEAARHAFAPRRPSGSARAWALRAAADGGLVVVVDDVLTTGNTVAAVAEQLWRIGAPVAFVATLAASRLRGGSPVAVGED
jgi:predicted amidophosphoribosyltransferase